MEMTETQANTIAAVWNGVPWQPMPGFWMVIVIREDGRLVAFDDDGVGEYLSEQCFVDNDAMSQIVVS